jgi:predicted kinase
VADTPVLIVVSGLPATGKSTVASALVRRTRFAYVRVDRIEQAIMVAYGVAAEQLRHGVSVVAECVNPLAVTRDAWRGVAEDSGARVLEVELICTDEAAHAERARTREVDIPGLALPSWQQITGREYEPWDRAHLVIDTAIEPPAGAVAAILGAAAAMGDHVPAA